VIKPGIKIVNSWDSARAVVDDNLRGGAERVDMLIAYGERADKNKKHSHQRHARTKQNTQGDDTWAKIPWSARQKLRKLKEKRVVLVSGPALDPSW
jgi:hypothetical protein